MLFLLSPVKDWYPTCDRVFSFVIRADDEMAARGLAAAKAGEEGREAWLDLSKTHCRELSLNGQPGILCRDLSTTWRPYPENRFKTKK